MLLLLGTAGCAGGLAVRSVAAENEAAALTGGSPALDTEAVGPHRFIAAHGRRALVSGYATGSLEVWAYPFQIVSGYRVQFRSAGATTPIRGEEILARVTYEPESVTRTYLGPDFIVREKLFAPLDESGAIISYQVVSGRGVEIEVHATPVLDLMWPGSMGGQGVSWNGTLSAFLLSEGSNGFTALVGSPEIAAHDSLANRTAGGENANALGFTLHPDAYGAAHVFFALNKPHVSDIGLFYQRLIQDRDSLEARYATHVQEFEANALHVETPDAEVNKAIAWAETALDQAWVCNPDLGCGYVAGYGPSRGARRPQYDWFFAGDGLITAEGGMAASDTDHARQELDFILKYQDRKTGMIWHELSQSAGVIDWAGDYPFMFVHVDITFQFLTMLDHYLAASGDVAFAREHWKAIEAAYRYCKSVIDPVSGLPRIPDDKEGGNEQDRLTDDLGLSTSWVQAAQGFARVATLTGHTALADDATRAAQLARATVPTRYWSARRTFWVNGYSATGEGAPERRSGPAEALTLHLFSPEQNATLLDTLASASFQTDWGTRSVAEDSFGYEPESYAKGSVWAVGTASLAKAFWSEYRPVTALGIWRTLIPSASLDSLGHMDEVLAGNFYRTQGESVPEQSWSSAGFLDATIHGLLGLDVDSVQGRIVFAPRLPAQWDHVSIEHIKLGNAIVGLTLRRRAHGLTLNIDNPGPVFHFDFSPEIPLGSRAREAELERHSIPLTQENHGQGANARLLFDAPHGKSELHIDLHGGVQVSAEQTTPVLGTASRGVHVVGTSLEGNTLTIVADVPRDRATHFELQTDWPVVKAEGATASPSVDGVVELTIAAVPDPAAAQTYRRAKCVVQFRP